MSDIRAKFGASVRKYREKQNLTQEQLAERAGLHWTYIGQVERGVRNPSLINIQKIAKGLKITGGDLLPF